ncbi:pre-rRNA-processing protein TSR2 homolog [Planococcus citri]|uniref:pre-rRNA-processing protein TSR2 homolog n=1 Tax=Planococcus citri TaxID=170843 RepID=UPI0031F8D9E4
MASNEFCDCVISVFGNWSALQLAVDHGMGGSPQETHKKVSDMANSIATLCFSKNVTDGVDIASELEDLMDDNFDTLLEDGSADEVGQLLWDLSRQWLSGDKDGVNSYIASLKKDVLKNHVKSEVNPEVTEEMDVVEDAGSSSNVPSNQPDPDGWVVVKKTRGQRH